MTITVCTQLGSLCSTCLHVPWTSRLWSSDGDGQDIRSNGKSQDHLAKAQTWHSHFHLILMAKPKNIAKLKVKSQGNVFYLYGRNPRPHDREYEQGVGRELGVNTRIYFQGRTSFPTMHINKLSPYDCTRYQFFFQ